MLMFSPVRPTSRRCIVRAQIERLESRCLLAFAAASEEPPVTDWLIPIESGGIEIVEPSSSKFHLPEIELGDLPAIPIPVPGDWPPTDWPPSDWPPSNWPPSSSPELPSGNPPEAPSGDWQEPSDPGGLIDIGDVENSGPDTFVDPAAKREELAVIEMLAALSYRPGRKGSESNLQSDLAADELNSGFSEDNAASGQPLQSADSEGGMMEIAADAVISKFAEEETPPNTETESLNEIPVRMDNAYGKFQMFEVSTTEVTAPGSVTPLSQPAARTEHIHAAEVTDLAEPDPTASDRSPQGRIHDTPREIDEPVLDHISPADGEIAPSGAASPRVDDETSSTSWDSGIALFTAAAVAFALRVHLAKREPDRDRRPGSWPWPHLVPRH